jgi:hypothetical protein
VPFYSPTQPNAAQYVYDVTLHELGHSFGMNDAPVPTDPATGQPDYSLQPAGGSIMNGSVNTNDQGPHGPVASPQAGGVGATAVQPCDKTRITSANPVQTITPNNGGGSKSNPAGPVPTDPIPPSNGVGGSGCTTYEEWDDTTNTLTSYSDC